MSNQVYRNSQVKYYESVNFNKYSLSIAIVVPGGNQIPLILQSNQINDPRTQFNINQSNGEINCILAGVYSMNLLIRIEANTTTNFLTWGLRLLLNETIVADLLDKFSVEGSGTTDDKAYTLSYIGYLRPEDIISIEVSNYKGTQAFTINASFTDLIVQKLF